MNDFGWRFIDRFKEPSSWAAFAVPLAALGVSMPAGIVPAISMIGAGICVLLGVLLKEGA